MKIALHQFLLSLFVLLCCSCGGKAPSNNNEETRPTIMPEVFAMADSIMARKPETYGSWNYETGTVLRGFQELYEHSGEEKYFQYIKSTVDSVVSQNGTIRSYDETDYNLDEIKQGSQLLYLFEKTQDERYKLAAEKLKQQIQNQPRTQSGGFWHKNKYPNQMWLDGLYMAQPFYTHYSVLFDETENFDDVMLQLTMMEEKSYDSTTGLLFHAWDESRNANWANSESGQSPVFWGRSMGWYLMALVDVLDFWPEADSEKRTLLIQILERLVVSLQPYQDSQGLWWQVTDEPYNNQNWQESSATAMYTYAIAKGVRKGYLDNTHMEMAILAWEGLNTVFVNKVNELTNLAGVCEGTGVGSSAGFYYGRRALTNDPKGLGPYLLAGIEMSLSSTR